MATATRKAQAALSPDQMQERLRQRGRRTMWVYGIVTLLYIPLIVVAAVSLQKLLWGGVFDQWLVSMLQSIPVDVNADGGRMLRQVQAVVKLMGIAGFLLMVLIPMIFAAINFLACARRNREFTYITSAQYMRNLVESQADEATKETMQLMREKLMYRDRRCPNCQVMLFTPPEGLVECPSCGKMV